MAQILKDKIAVVTGSTRGYGYAIAESLLQAGATVVITGRNQEALDGALGRLQPGGPVKGFILDVRNEEQIYQLVDTIVQEFGHIDIWINNAGYSYAAGMVLDMDPQEALEMFLSNSLGVMRCTQAVMGHLLPRGQGMLVNIYGQGSFLQPASPTGLYGASKAWASSFTRTLAKETRGSGIRILGFSPGMLTTDMLTSPHVIGERGKSMMKNYGFVLRLLARSPKSAADSLVKAIAGQRKPFVEIRLFKPWTPLLGLIRVGWQKLTGADSTPEYELHYLPAYKFRDRPRS